MTKIIIPKSVATIEDSAFGGCASLTSITIPSNVTLIEDAAFWGCYSLKFIAVADDNQFYDARNNCNAVIETSTNKLIVGCENTVIPNSVTCIGESAFAGCGLKSITIPNSVTTIGDYAFEGCTSLASITIPNSVMTIGFLAFEWCSSLTSVIIPNSVTNIGYRAFKNCSGLTSIKVENGNRMYDSRDNCDAIIETASNTLIAGCKNTIIPESVTSIVFGAFDGCSGLTSITIPNSVTTIGRAAFLGCSGLTSVTIPNSVTSIGGSAFYGCSGLTSITIPNSVTSIGTSAFYECNVLEKVVSLIEEPFEIVGKEDSWNQCFDTNTFKNATLYVPEGTIDRYKATTGWKDFDHIVVPDAVKELRAEESLKTDEGLKEVYRLDGRRGSKMQRGINVVRKKNGTTQKVLVK